jgi:hypothetical protein
MDWMARVLIPAGARHFPLLRFVSRYSSCPHPFTRGAVMAPDQAMGSTRLHEGCLRSAKQIAAFATSLQSICLFSYPGPLSDKTVCLPFCSGLRVHKIPFKWGCIFRYVTYIQVAARRVTESRASFVLRCCCLEEILVVKMNTVIQTEAYLQLLPNCKTPE